MNKLKNKVFLVIFIILSLFLISIICIFNYQNYKNEKENIISNLMRVNSVKDNEHRNDFDPSNKPSENMEKDNLRSEPKIFMDNTVYTAILNDDNEVVYVINHTQNDVNDETIKNIAESIVLNKNSKNLNVGNLYFEQYSYFFTRNNTITIIDNSLIKERLISLIKTSLIIFVLLECVIIFVAIKLTSWIIKPVIQSFNKQKQFIADASHELKTPLTVIMANAEALENEPQEKKWLNNIKSESERMSNLISDLLDMAKLENGVKEQYSNENISKIIEREILTFESIIYEKKIKLNYEIEENIFLNCNTNQIKQVVSILLDNAIKHSFTENGEIYVGLKKEKNNISLEVKNKGKEIPKEKQEKIFERFYRVDESRNRDENRYGLGLSIAKNIVENHNGKISVNSSNEYTTFKIIFKN